MAAKRKVSKAVKAVPIMARKINPRGATVLIGSSSQKSLSKKQIGARGLI